MAKSKPAWIIHYKDMGQADFFAIFLTEAAALKRLANAVAGYAQGQLEALEWEGGPPESLQETIKAEKAGKYSDAIAAWEEFSYDHGPVDATALLIDSEIMD